MAAAAPAGKPFAPPGASAWGQRQLIHSPTRGRQIAAARWTPKHARSAEVGGGSGLPEPAPAATGAEREEASRRCLDWRDTPVAPLGQKPRVRITGAGEGPAGGEREEAPGEASEVGAVEGRLASMGEMRSSSSSLLTSELAESASAGEEKHGLTGEAGSVMRRARALAGRRYCSGDEWCSSMARLSAAEAEAAAVVVPSTPSTGGRQAVAVAEPRGRRRRRRPRRLHRPTQGSGAALAPRTWPRLLAS